MHGTINIKLQEYLHNSTALFRLSVRAKITSVNRILVQLKGSKLFCIWKLHGRCTIFGLRFRQKDSFRLGPSYTNARWKRGWVGPRAVLDGVINCLQSSPSTKRTAFEKGTHFLSCISVDNFRLIRDIFPLYDK